MAKKPSPSVAYPIGEKRNKIAREYTLDATRKRQAPSSSHTQRMDALLGGFQAKALSDDDVVRYRLPGKDIELRAEKPLGARRSMRARR